MFFTQIAPQLAEHVAPSLLAQLHGADPARRERAGSTAWAMRRRRLQSRRWFALLGDADEAAAERGALGAEALGRAP